MSKDSKIESLGSDELYQLGMLENDEKASAEYFKVAADKGHAASQFQVGLVLEAFRYIKLAADQNYHGNGENANLILSYYYETGGHGCEKDEKKAFEHCKIAVEQNDTDAIHRLAEFYQNGIGCKKNLPLALRYYNLINYHAHNITGYDLLDDIDLLKNENEVLKNKNNKLKETIIELEETIIELEYRPEGIY